MLHGCPPQAADARLARISDPLQASLEGSRLPVTPLPTAARLRHLLLYFKSLQSTLISVDVGGRIPGPAWAVSTCCNGRQAAHRPACETGFHPRRRAGRQHKRRGAPPHHHWRHHPILVHRQCRPGCPPSASGTWLVLEPTVKPALRGGPLEHSGYPARSVNSFLGSGGTIEESLRASGERLTLLIGR
jgi:hypothetical protein